MLILEIVCFLATAAYLGKLLRRHPEILRSDADIGLESACKETSPQLSLSAQGVRS